MNFSKLILVYCISLTLTACGGLDKITRTTDNTEVPYEPAPKEGSNKKTDDKANEVPPTVKAPTAANYLEGCLENENIIYRVPRPTFNDSDLLICGILANLNFSIFNGCWECAPDHEMSVHRQAGLYGKNTSGDSIRNRASAYGSNTNEGSVCNLDPSRPPRLVQKDGTLKGHLSVSVSFEGSICNESSEFFNSASCVKLKAYCYEL